MQAYNFFSGLNDVFAAKACSGDKLALNCSSYDYTINIVLAWYQTSHSCAQNLSTEVSSCRPFDAKETIVTHCQDYKECHITLSESLFNYTCGFERPQLKVFYQCTSKNLKSKYGTLLYDLTVNTSTPSYIHFSFCVCTKVC